MKTANLNGAWGEELAAKYLRRKGYKIVEKNYRSRYGEIDIIAEDRNFLVFAEVKLRKNDSHGSGRDFVTARKQERLKATALLYLSQHPGEKQPRFDVVEIFAPDGTATKKPIINHLEDAFS